MKTRVEIHESMLGEFARKEDAEAVGLALIDRGWPVIYAEEGQDTPAWQFESLADYRRFMGDFEDVRDELANAGSVRIVWRCDCQELQDHPCPHGQDPTAGVERLADRPLDELYGWALRQAMERHYPELRGWIETAIDSLYGALAFGLMLEEATGTPSAAGLWLRRKWPKRHGGTLREKTYDRAIADFAELAHHAADDAWFSEYLARERIKLDELERCPECGDIRGMGCRCDGGEAE